MAPDKHTGRQTEGQTQTNNDTATQADIHASKQRHNHTGRHPCRQTRAWPHKQASIHARAIRTKRVWHVGDWDIVDGKGIEGECE